MLNLSDLYRDREFEEGDVRPVTKGLRIPAVDGSTLLGIMMTPGGKPEEIHPTVLLLHGFPGNAQNVDLAEALRRVGMNTVVFHYRGNWGSAGDYCLSHLPEDSISVLDYLREHAAELRVDPDKIYLIGHSMGGFTAVQLLAAGVKAAGTVFMAPCNVANMYTEQREAFDSLVSNKSDYFRMESPQPFYDECELHKDDWSFKNAAEKFDPDMPVLVVRALRDSLDHEVNLKPLTDVLEVRQKDYEYAELDTSHAYDSSRCALYEVIAEWLVRQITK